MRAVDGEGLAEGRAEGWQVEVFHDGDCPLCAREVALLRRLDRGRGRIRFTDVAAPDFDAAAHGKAHDDFMARIHGRLPDGTWLEGVEVFRRLYAAVGLGPLVAATRLPGVSHLLDAGYRVFARNRLRWTGRCDASCAAPPRGAAPRVEASGGETPRSVAPSGANGRARADVSRGPTARAPGAPASAASVVVAAAP